MSTKIYTIGFAGKSAEQFFGLLRDTGVRVLVDIRENRGGQLSGFAKYPDIAFFLDRVAGIAYEYEPRLAPTPEIRKLYRSTRNWDQYEVSFRALLAAALDAAAGKRRGERGPIFMAAVGPGMLWGGIVLE